MKSLHERMLENLIFIREMMIAKGQNVDKISRDIEELRVLLEKDNGGGKRNDDKE